MHNERDVMRGRGKPAVADAQVEALTIGHSTLPYERFLGLLRRCSVTAVADAQNGPLSRYSPALQSGCLAQGAGARWHCLCVPRTRAGRSAEGQAALSRRRRGLRKNGVYVRNWRIPRLLSHLRGLLLKSYTLTPGVNLSWSVPTTLSNHPHAPKTRRDRKPENAPEKVNKPPIFWIEP